MLQEAKEKYTEQLKKIIRAAVGGTMLVQEEIEEFVGKCVEKGEIAEKDGKNLISDLFSKRKKATQDKIHETQGKLQGTLSSLESTIDTRIESILKAMHIPTKDDVTSVNAKIEEVLSKLEKLEGGTEKTEAKETKESKSTKESKGSKGSKGSKEMQQA